jgi:hypothetical protein
LSDFLEDLLAAAGFSLRFPYPYRLAVTGATDRLRLKNVQFRTKLSFGGRKAKGK